MAGVRAVTAPTPPEPRRTLARLSGADTPRGRKVIGASLVGLLVGVAVGFDAGQRMGGWMPALFMALNGGMFCSLMAGWLAERLLPGRNARR